ncbi:hypothetical protein PR202_gb06841 [Eleusine coracana subsp. coracana]|uniref:Uncharacterized protein n=1 Tax=Eleusine coracana subsp. coracana TaxID=191504 RepID=A0AAV5EB16_ELECO|nr:hypothetical protein PR202_gb06841 [Eleusine coracana subsp. coracana]
MAAGSAIRVTMEVGADGVALITICNPPVNALHPRSKSSSSQTPPFPSLSPGFLNSPRRSNPFRVRPRSADAVFDGLKEKYNEAMARDDVKAIVLTGEISPQFYYALIRTRRLLISGGDRRIY